MSRLVLTGGGTGGHIMPLLDVGDVLCQKGWKVRFIGSRYGLEGKLVPQRGYSLTRLPVRGMMGRGFVSRAGRGVLVPIATAMAILALVLFRPDAVFSTGGYAAFPVLAACRICGIPYVLLEQNAYPGKVNEIFAKHARKVFVGFEPAIRYLNGDVEITGNPVSPEFFQIPPAAFPDGPVQMVILGGSQGSRVLNRLMVQSLSAIQSLGISITHQTGPAEHAGVSSAYRDLQIPSRVEAFIYGIPELLSRTHLVLSRAGAMSVSEIAASGRSGFFIPFAGAYHDHQTMNARALVDENAAWLLSEREAQDGAFIKVLKEILSDPNELVRRGNRARELSNPQALSRITSFLLGLVQPAGGAHALS